MTTSQDTFAAQGYLVFENALSADELALLRDSCQHLLDEPVDDGGEGGKHKIGLGEARRFLAHRHEEFPELEKFLLSEKIGGILAACNGKDGLLFNEQFVVKGAGKGASFAWHQDGAYVGFDHAPYLTVWIAMDDATEENGCVYLIPRDLTQNPDLDPHEWQEDSNELNGYFGTDTGTPMVCKAGTIVVFSSLTLHRSGPNVTDKPRRAYVCQYSPEPICVPETGKPKRFAKPVAPPAAALV
ncbi:phytanoyl-CoA dioxygenase family protein [Mameliella sediminis]|uniref:phytanoyl-CoA dioxygenase family protein n=1 Tax=Mameliella sediminis TaxID=2836866 RepID=UPI001C44E1AB|nr:phytanoyl-CoA dioxygenase family protein [Mameliella sediminis]MBY6115407.1 phytanoyl-CoA dioxygenase family protein [Antarctobacter heliothermus]MBY6144528.1 phytanoyl-CoA dioxygenase family protein [Mameliella alba]MBV7395643.1 phytanoyl-CoA dioxygenase family protein [Mameliella sediminis]MBY6174254.1 phytanoyl-CoA dioxygenase family protein [Mameliella alba]MCA0956216.1 phytanoyl-CoA dioxygenase family protein [Mameliella alba]